MSDVAGRRQAKASLIFLLGLFVCAEWVFYPFTKPSPVAKFRDATLNVITDYPHVSEGRFVGFVRLGLKDIPVFNAPIKMNELALLFNISDPFVPSRNKKRILFDNCAYPCISRGEIHAVDEASWCGGLNHFGINLGTRYDGWSIVPVRFKAEDLKAMTQAARANKQTVSEWIRSTIHANL